MGMIGDHVCVIVTGLIMTRLPS